MKRGAKQAEQPNLIAFSVYPPPRALHPNSRAHWMERAKWTRWYRQTVMLSFWEQFGTSYRPEWQKAALTLTFRFPTERRRDEDNLRAWWKAGQDTLKDGALYIIPDDTPKYLELRPIRVVVDKTQPAAVLVELERLA